VERVDEPVKKLVEDFRAHEQEINQAVANDIEI